MPLFVFDVGGSHITGALMQLEDMSLLARESVALDCHGLANDFFVAVEQLVGALLSGSSASHPQGMSFGFPGPFDYAGGVSHLEHKYESLKGRNLRRDLSEQFDIPGDRIHFVNDADAFLLGELTQLSISPTSRSIGITLGTGVGSAFAIGEGIVHHAEGVPDGGEIWNLPWNDGILEDAISTRAIVRAYEAKTGARRSVKEIALSCPLEGAAAQVFAELGSNLGGALKAIASPFHPDRIILGGAISRSADLFLPSLAETLGPEVELKVSTLFEDAALYGAAAHWKHTTAQQMNS